MLGRGTGALVVALAVLPLASCGPDSHTDLEVEIQCVEEMFLHIHVVQEGPLPSFPKVDLDTAPYAVPFQDESVGRFDLSSQQLELYLIRVTHPNQVAGPIPITLADLEPLYPGDDAPVSRFVVREDQCPSPDDPPR